MRKTTSCRTTSGSLASFLIVAARADEAAVTTVMGQGNIETTRRIYAGD
jgi:hypothetical protein